MQMRFYPWQDWPAMMTRSNSANRMSPHPTRETRRNTLSSHQYLLMPFVICHSLFDYRIDLCNNPDAYFFCDNSNSDPSASHRVFYIDCLVKSLCLNNTGKEISCRRENFWAKICAWYSICAGWSHMRTPISTIYAGTPTLSIVPSFFQFFWSQSWYRPAFQQDLRLYCIIYLLVSGFIKVSGLRILNLTAENASLSIIKARVPWFPHPKLVVVDVHKYYL